MVIRIKKANAILKRLVNKLFPIEYTYQNIHQTDKEREQKLSREAAVFSRERVHALLLACIYCDIFLAYDKIIDIYASKYQRKMFVINPLSKN